ncbi:MAG: dethiobiotin synthase [Polaromonas sp.]|nr:dethiobiotin synthase [Polaromonas sp.]
MAERAGPALSLFVTGTDTGVGKTLVSAGLLHALARYHPRVVGMKPVAAGTELIDGVAANDDVLALRAASSCRVPPELDNPVLLPDALSPHIAAQRAGVRIDIEHLVACQRALALRADAVVVEGAGGFMVPLSALETGADLAGALGLPVLLVVGLRLGCLNHALLTAEAIRARGLTLAGWVANQVDAAMLAPDDNIAFLQRQLRAPLLARIAYQAAPDPRALTFNLPSAWQ